MPQYELPAPRSQVLSVAVADLFGNSLRSPHSATSPRLLHLGRDGCQQQRRRVRQRDKHKCVVVICRENSGAVAESDCDVTAAIDLSLMIRWEGAVAVLRQTGRQTAGSQGFCHDQKISSMV